MVAGAGGLIYALRMHTLETQPEVPEVTVLNRQRFSSEYWNTVFTGGTAFNDHPIAANLAGAQNYDHTRLTLTHNPDKTSIAQGTYDSFDLPGTAILANTHQAIGLEGGRQVAVTHWASRDLQTIQRVRSIQEVPLYKLACYDFTDELCQFAFEQHGERYPKELQAARLAIRHATRETEASKAVARRAYRREKMLGGLVAPALIPHVSIALGVRRVQA